jgi:hypothetical protein
MVTSTSPGIALLLISEIVRLGFDPMYFPFKTKKQANTLVGNLPWDIFVGVWPHIQGAASASVAVAKQTNLGLQSIKIVDFGGEALLVAKRHNALASDAEAERLLAALDRLIAQAGLDTAPRGTIASDRDVVSRAKLRGLAHDLNNLLTIMVGCGEVLLHRSADDPPTRKYAEWLLTALARVESIAEYLKEDCGLSDPSSVADISSSLAGFRCLMQMLAGHQLQTPTDPDPEQSS